MILQRRLLVPSLKNTIDIITTIGTSTWIVPDRVKSIDLFLVGGGGGGGSSLGAGGGSGGGGGYTATYLDVAVTPGQELTLIVGHGGLGSEASKKNYDGYPGGNTFVKSTDFSYSVDGGLGGSGGVGDNAPGGSGGSGGGGSATSYNTNGSNGGSDGSNGSGNGGIGQGTTTKVFGETTGRLCSGGGGGSANASYPSGSGGPGGGGDGHYTAGLNATYYGGGGGGTYIGPNGGNGYQGVIMIRY